MATINDSAWAGTITLNSIRRMTKAEGPLGGTPTNGSYLVANFTVTVTSGSFDVNPLFFKASSSDGTTFNSELGVLNKQIDSATLTAGRQVRGDVAFDAPVGSLLVDYGIFGPPLATFSFKG